MHKLVNAFVVLIANCFLRSNLNDVVFSVNRLCSTSIAFPRDHFADFYIYIYIYIYIYDNWQDMTRGMHVTESSIL